MAWELALGSILCSTVQWYIKVTKTRHMEVFEGSTVVMGVCGALHVPRTYFVRCVLQNVLPKRYVINLPASSVRRV